MIERGCFLTTERWDWKGGREGKTGVQGRSVVMTMEMVTWKLRLE